MKLKRGEERTVYLQESNQEPLERDALLGMIVGKTLDEQKETVARFEKATETVWVDKFGRPEARSKCGSVKAISIKPADGENRQMELLDDLKLGLEAISSDDCSLADIRRALRAQIAYSEFMDLMDD